MKNILTFIVLFFGFKIAAQVPYNAAIPNGYSRKAIVAEQVGSTLVTITYHRPSVKGREGKIWGSVVHKGFVDQGFGSGKPSPWRAGANENTIIEIDQDITVEGKLLPKGKYGLFIAYDPAESIIIFSKMSDAWGSFFYDEKEDALRVSVKPKSLLESVEHLKYEFTAQTVNSAIVTLSWEKLSIPFTIEVDHLRQQFDQLVTELQNPRSFTAQALNAAANWSLQNNYQLERALEWATTATSNKFPGDPTSFPCWITKATLLEKLGKGSEASLIMKNALQYGTLNQIQQYGRQLLAAKRFNEAFSVFEFNYNRTPNEFIAIVGMVRGLSGTGEFSKALELANKALPLAPNESNKQAVQEMIEKLKAGQSVN